MMDANVELRTTPFRIAVHRNRAAVSVLWRDHQRRHDSIDHNTATNNGSSGYHNQYNRDHYHHVDYSSHDNYH
ncbi:hypothetical protein JYT35_00795 [Acidimicrobium ferrooxidans]|uniref:Uncharacterized protein n=1 Tax=Acidimicrobium ferrooxidans TaxID=53635 RepID=A0ABS3AP49_9ACTN|nr:hypothetical protein [Acidimicrobium ferrooxidans]